MKKISTLYKKDINDLGRVINEVAEENAWVFECGIPTRKFDGTSCMIKNCVLYKRYDVKKGRTVPIGAIPCQEADPITGHHPHWIPCDRSNPQDKHHFDAFSKTSPLYWDNGTYELCGPKINGNREQYDTNVLIKHGSVILTDVTDLSFEGLRKYLEEHDIEGIVFHDVASMDGRMCKIRKTDFGIKR